MYKDSLWFYNILIIDLAYVRFYKLITYVRCRRIRRWFQLKILENYSSFQWSEFCEQAVRFRPFSVAKVDWTQERMAQMASEVDVVNQVLLVHLENLEFEVQRATVETIQQLVVQCFWLVALLNLRDQLTAPHVSQRTLNQSHATWMCFWNDGTAVLLLLIVLAYF